MRLVLSTALALGLCCSTAFADEKVTGEEAGKLKEIVKGPKAASCGNSSKSPSLPRNSGPAPAVA